MSELLKYLYRKPCMDKGSLYLPNNPNNFTVKDVFRFLENLTIEQDQLAFGPTEKTLLDKALLERYRDRRLRPFFLYHFMPLWVAAVKHLLPLGSGARILELGCGTGQTSLLLALLGADVRGIDLDGNLIDICLKRKHFYESHRHGLKANFFQGDAFAFDYQKYAPLDAVYSLFAFNLMKPANKLIPHLAGALRSGGRLIVTDGNHNSIWSSVPSRKRPGVPSPKLMAQILEDNNFKILHLDRHCILPPQTFRWPLMAGFAMQLEGGLKHLPLYKWLCISYTIVAEKI